jgi:hypothetical protein
MSLAQGLTVNQMVEELLNYSEIAGIVYANAAYTGAGVAGGKFWGAAAPIGIDHGAMLSSGKIVSVVGETVFPWNKLACTTTNNGTLGDGDVTNIVGRPTHDAAVLEFDITSTTGDRLLVFEYVFGSEEYPEWVGTRYNDGFGIWIDGVNIAVIPPVLGAPPVTVSNVGPGHPWYVGNAGSNRETELDGLTQSPGAGPVAPAIPVNSLVHWMTQGQAYHVKVAIADATDHFCDSDVFLKTRFDVGACCIDNTTCTDGVLAENCTGVWTEGVLCENLDPPCGQIGACCLPYGDCVEMWQVPCTETAGSYLGDGTTCGAIGACTIGESCIETSEDCCTDAGGSWQAGACPPIVTGACCLDRDTCVPDQTESECADQDGIYQGNGTQCVPDDLCLRPYIPTVSEWGLVVMTLLVIAAATVVIRRARAMKTTA